MAEFAEIVGRTIGKFMVGLSPHVLGRVELRGVGGEVMDVESGMVHEKGADFPPPVDWPAIPEQGDGATQMPQ
jgi:hypothetical protein